jgi:hypothetical protein
MTENLIEESMPLVDYEFGAPNAAHGNWEPKWFVDVGDGCTLGIGVDDNCFLVLTRYQGRWRPSKYIPKEAAAKISQLLACGVLN